MAKIVIRLLDPNNQLLGWEEIDAQMKDGYLLYASHLSVPVDTEGELAFLSIHWADLNVEWRTLAPSSERKRVFAGDKADLHFEGGRVAKVGDPPANPLPPTTSRGDVVIGIPVGRLGVSGNA